MNTKLRIKIGQMEIDYEGSEVFLKESLLGMVNTLHAAIKDSSYSYAAIDQTPLRNLNDVETNDLDIKIPKLALNSVAQKLSVKTGPDLILAAAAKFEIIDGKKRFSNKELMSEIKLATSYYSKNYSKNGVAYVNTLVKNGKLNDLGSKFYSLTAELKSDFLMKLK